MGNLRAMKEVKPEAGAAPLFYYIPVNDKGGPCNAHDCNNHSGCVLQLKRQQCTQRWENSNPSRSLDVDEIAAVRMDIFAPDNGPLPCRPRKPHTQTGTPPQTHTRGPGRGALRPARGGVGVHTKQPRCTSRGPRRETDGTGNRTRE